MLPYIAISLLVVTLSFIDLVRLDKVYKDVIFFVIIFFLTIFLGTRMVGPDLWTYESFYLITPPLPTLLPQFGKYTLLTSFEPLFLMLYGVFKWIGSSFQMFNLLFTAGFMYLFTRKLKRYTPFVLISVLIFLAYGYISGFSAIRQVMAASIFFYALEYLNEGKVWKYAFAILIASLFHTSAVILWIFCFVYQKKFSSLAIVLVLVGIILLVYSGFLSSIAGAILSRVPIFSPARVALYLSQEGSFIGSVSITWMVLLGISLYHRSKLEQLDPHFNLYLNILWIGFALFAISVGFGGFGRVLMYFKLVYLIILPLYVQLVKEAGGKVLAIMLIAVMSISLFLAAILTDTRYAVKNRYLPYKSWLIHEK